MKIKVSDLTGIALDWAVAEVDQVDAYFIDGALVIHQANSDGGDAMYTPSTNWLQGGPIIDQMTGYTMQDNGETGSESRYYCATASIAEVWHNHPVSGQGSTPLIATMRCYVQSKLGDEVEIPNELL